MKRYFQISVKDPSGKIVGPVGVTGAPDQAAGLRADAVAIAKVLAAAPEGSTLAYLQDLGQIDID
jgi:hypothetical protein